jgi:micrococcal nuclease
VRRAFRTARDLALFALLLLLLCPPEAPARTAYGRVVKVFDGDTLLVRLQGRDEHVRLREIDAPEVTHRRKIGQEPWGGRARSAAESLVRAKTVLLEIEDREERDKYRRLLAYVFSGDLFVNREMVRSGNAFYYPGPSPGRHAAELQRAEETARENGVGVWDRKNGLTEKPQDFRRRTHRSESFFSRIVRILRGGEKEKKPPSSVALPADKIVGNRRSMIYHLPGSSNAARVSPRNRVFFDSAAEAEKAGFRPAREPAGAARPAA